MCFKLQFSHILYILSCIIYIFINLYTISKHDLTMNNSIFIKINKTLCSSKVWVSKILEIILLFSKNELIKGDSKSINIVSKGFYCK